MAEPFRSGKSGRIGSSDLRMKLPFGFSQRIASRFFGDPPLTGSQTDNFNDNSIDTAKWQNNSGARITEVNNQIEITTLTTAGYYSLETKEWQSLYNSSVSVKLTSAGNQTLVSLEVYPIVISSNAGLNTLEFIVSGGTVFMFKRESGVSTNLGGSFTYNAVTHLYFRIREQDGLVYFDTSADGTTWTNRRTIATPMSLNRIKPVFQVGNYAVEASGTLASFDDYNITGSGTLYSQSLTESIVVVDVIRRTPSRLLIDPITVVDTLRRTTNRLITEAVTIVDTFAGSKVLVRAYSEAISLVDTVTKSTSRTLLEAVTVVDILTKTSSRFLSEAISIVDVIAKQGGKSLVEAITVVDTVAKSTTRRLIEAITIIDTSIRTITRQFIESISLVDVFAGAKITILSLVESLVVVDTVRKFTSRTISEVLTLIDTMIRTTTRQFIETITVVDTFAFFRVIARTFTEALVLVDTLRKTASRRIIESISVIDSFLGEVIVLVIKSIGNWIVYSLTGLAKIVKGERKSQTLSTTKQSHVLLLSERSFTVSTTDITHTNRTNKTP